ncbi:hypothetical protein ScPMuIL_015265 [Solemya velum]
MASGVGWHVVPYFVCVIGLFISDCLAETGTVEDDVQSYYCPCSCDKLHDLKIQLNSPYQNMTEGEKTEYIEKQTEEVKKEMAVKKNETSSIIALYVSAQDERPTAGALGYILGIGLLTTLGCVIVLSDVASIFRDGKEMVVPEKPYRAGSKQTGRITDESDTYDDEEITTIDRESRETPTPPIATAATSQVPSNVARRNPKKTKTRRAAYDATTDAAADPLTRDHICSITTYDHSGTTAV